MDKLFFFTTLPKERAYKSWERYAKSIYVFDNNDTGSKEEFIKIKEKEIDLFGKKTFKISDVVDKASQIATRFVLINGDIEIKQDDDMWKKITSKKGLVCGQRYNYSNDKFDFKINLGGIDFFIVDNLKVPDDDNFCFGLPCWDWWLVFLAQQQNLNISFIKFPFFFHKKHKRNWEKSYPYMPNYFKKVTNKQINDFRRSFINLI